MYSCESVLCITTLVICLFYTGFLKYIFVSVDFRAICDISMATWQDPKTSFCLILLAALILKSQANKRSVIQLYKISAINTFYINKAIL